MLMELADRMKREQVTLGFTGLSPDLRGFLSDWCPECNRLR